MLRNLRLTELGLLGTAAITSLLALATVNLMKNGQASGELLLPGVVVMGAAVAVHLGLIATGFKGDQLPFAIAMMLSGIGLALVTRLAPELAIKQTIWILIGLATMVGVLVFPRPVIWLKRYKYTFAILGLMLVLTTFVIGKDPNQSGARLWLSFAGLSFQPSELLKVLLAVFLAAYLDDKRELLSAAVYRVGPLRLPPLPYLAPLLVMWGVSVLVLFGQRDLGPTLLLFGVFVSMLYVTSSRTVYVWSGLGLFAVAVALAVRFIGHAAVRFEIWLNPWNDPQVTGYQLIQALVAMANGGLLGTGLGRGHPDLIPAVFTDFPFAALAEEAGMIGALGLLAIYITLIYRGLRIAIDAQEGFQKHLAAALAIVLGLQTLIIVGGNLRMIPLTGITLPFVSYGGSSLLANFLIIGLLLRISHDSCSRTAK